MPEEVSLFSVEERITLYLISLKIYPCLSGFYFLKEAIKNFYTKGAKTKSINNVLYKEIFIIFNNDCEFIDCKMRHAIQSASKRNGFYKFGEKFNCKTKNMLPSPKELIIAIAIKLSKEAC